MKVSNTSGEDSRHRKVDQPRFDLSEGTDKRPYSFSIEINAFF